MLEKILVPLDGSPRAEAVLTQLGRILCRKDAEVILLRAVEPPATMNGVVYSRLLDERRVDARDYLMPLKDRLMNAGLRAVARIGEGYPADVILEATNSVRATLIAMSTHGRTGIDRWAFGSVAEKVLRACAVPLLVVRSFAPAAGGGPFEPSPKEAAYRRILLPIDGSDLSLQAVGPVRELAALFGAEVLLVHVVDPSAPSAPMPQIERARAILDGGGVRSDVVVREGDPAAEILSAASDRSADLVALASHGRTGVSRWVLGSVAEKVLRASSLPTLVVRTARADAGH